MADEHDYKHYYLPFLSGNSFRGKHKPRTFPTAFVEFCDIGKPEPTTELPREYHNHFKPSSLCLPKIQPRCVRERETHLSDIPVHSILPLASNKVPFTFTEGLSALSAPTPPLFPIQRSDVPPANLPNVKKSLEEKIKGQYTIERRITYEDTPRRTTIATKHIPLIKRDETLEPAVQDVKRLECRPFLKFAPNVIHDKRPKKHSIDLRSYTPYNKNMDTKFIVPKEIGMCDLDNVSWSRQKSFGNFYQQEINRLREKKSNNKLSTTCVLGVSSVSETKLELPFSVLRERKASKAMTNQSSVTHDINKSLTDFSQYKGDSEACTSTRFVIKMPITTDMHQNEISEVARLNTNNSNNRESSFEIDECQSISLSENRDPQEVDVLRLLSIEPIDIGEPLDSNKKLSPNYVEENIQSEDLSKLSDIVPDDSTGELAFKGNNSLETYEENGWSNKVDKELDENICECIKQIDTESEQPNAEDTPTELDANNFSEGVTKKLRLEVIVLKRTLAYREITTQMYYS
ncbi:hypothetical protein LOTGIDRAFT_161065 [Lottia gigantea]|uniref:Uncharacterized protein n=1 Tax=Lottia gigantea TaxID=225164 RepID=V4C065_LOTGI|nr:hypothetical protein LOTGIDRAFT_161065 [Lottia gigantea]ESO94814.1 hypothetical protein LOTGIDRAFT_161065 [Lottia gigantea]